MLQEDFLQGWEDAVDVSHELNICFNPDAINFYKIQLLKHG